jgi:23S rRNA pseudouridine955/2504/2580 synthase
LRVSLGQEAFDAIIALIQWQRMQECFPARAGVWYTARVTAKNLVMFMTATNPPSTHTAVRIYTVDGEQSGRRIDNFLTGLLGDIPKSRIYRMLRGGEVRVNGGRVKQNYRLALGDAIRIPPVRMAQEPAQKIEVPPQLQQLLERQILHESNDLLILDKPAGLPVHGGTGVRFGVIEILRGMRGPDSYLELAHRLDRDTSGCLILAKTPSRLREIHGMLKTGQIDKRYWALARGRWQGGGRAVENNLRKNTLQGGERMVQIDNEGKIALTRFAPVEIFSMASLLEAKLETGRTHQIRVHAAHIGHPLAGDQKYGDADFNRAMRAYGLRQLFLHARSLAFQHPGTGRPFAVEAPLPAELAQVLTRLRQTR